MFRLRVWLHCNRVQHQEWICLSVCVSVCLSVFLSLCLCLSKHCHVTHLLDTTSLFLCRSRNVAVLPRVARAGVGDQPVPSLRYVSAAVLRRTRSASGRSQEGSSTTLCSFVHRYRSYVLQRVTDWSIYCWCTVLLVMYPESLDSFFLLLKKKKKSKLVL